MLEWSDAPHDRMDVLEPVSTWVKMASGLGPVWPNWRPRRPNLTQGTRYEILSSVGQAPPSGPPVRVVSLINVTS